MIHIYGRMGYLPGFAKNGGPERAYERIQTRPQLNSAVAGMHLLRELRGDAARACLHTASGKVIFLGFAYAQENLEALDLAITCAGKTVFGTIFEIGEDEPHKEPVMRLKTFGVELNGRRGDSMCIRPCTRDPLRSCDRGRRH